MIVIKNFLIKYFKGEKMKVKHNNEQKRVTDFWYECPDCGFTTNDKNKTDHECLEKINW